MFDYKKSKGQVSLELVILIGVLITVAIVLAAVFLDFSDKSIASTKETVTGTDNTFDNFLSDLNTNKNNTPDDNGGTVIVATADPLVAAITSPAMHGTYSKSNLLSLHSVVSDGVPTYTCFWQVINHDSTSCITTSDACNVTTNVNLSSCLLGSATVILEAHDSNNSILTKTVGITISNTSIIVIGSELTVDLTSPRDGEAYSYLDKLPLSVDVSGGTSPYRYDWVIKDSAGTACASSTRARTEVDISHCRPDPDNPATVNLTVTDNAGNSDRLRVDIVIK